MGKAWLIGHITVKDAAKWDEYRSRVPATMAPFGAELTFRGTLAQVFSGVHAHTDVVVASTLVSEAASKIVSSVIASFTGTSARLPTAKCAATPACSRRNTAPGVCRLAMALESTPLIGSIFNASSA